MKQSRFILFVLSFLMMSIGNVYAQNIIVTGTVLDSTGEPVIGANVKVAGNSSVGTITDVASCGHKEIGNQLYRYAFTRDCH